MLFCNDFLSCSRRSPIYLGPKESSWCFDHLLCPLSLLRQFHCLSTKWWWYKCLVLLDKSWKRENVDGNETSGAFFLPSNHYKDSSTVVAKVFSKKPWLNKAFLHSNPQNLSIFSRSSFTPPILFSIPFTSSFLVVLFPLISLKHHKHTEILQVHYKGLFFPESFKSNLPTWCPVTSKYFSLCFLPSRVFSSRAKI